jgi:hypothetical protein
MLIFANMEATCYSVMSVDFRWITRRYIPDDRNLLYKLAISVYLLST